MQPHTYFNRIPKAQMLFTVSISAILLFVSACNSKPAQSAGAEGSAQGAPQSYPAFKLAAKTATLQTDYPATLEGQQNIEIRPKIDGYVEKIYIDEGSMVKKGQLLFSISAPQYQQEVNTAKAAISSAEADVNAADLQVRKAKPLVEKEIISNYELESLQYTLQARRATLAQAKANLANAKTNLGYTMITSPVNGVVGAIPYRLGSLVTSTTAQPLTTVSNIGKVYAYFSMNEKQLLEFSRQYSGNSLSAKLSKLPAVSLALADGTAYPEKGRVETINGLINTQTGSASFRATFPNPLGLIRSGGSATVRIPQVINNALLIPQKSTYELQGKRFAYVVDGNNKVKSTEIEIMNLANGQYFVVTKGLSTGDIVVLEATSQLQDNTAIKPAIQPEGNVYKDLN